MVVPERQPDGSVHRDPHGRSLTRRTGGRLRVSRGGRTERQNDRNQSTANE